MNHGKASFVLIFPQPAPCDLADLWELGDVLGLVTAVVHEEGCGSGFAVSADKRRDQVVNLLERRQQDDTCKVQV